MFGARVCNGICKYCCNRQSNQFGEKDDIKIDEEKLLNAIKNHPYEIKSFGIWGSEPLLHFEELKIIVDLLETNFPNIPIHLSSNGILLDIYYEYLIQHKIKTQLSYDGLGQIKMRGIDPIRNKGVIELAKHKLLCINCVVHKYNDNLLGNVEFFENWKKEYDIEVSVRFSPLMFGDNIVDGEDIQITNTKEFFRQADLILKRNDSYGKKFRQDMSRFRFVKRATSCRAFIIGKTKYSNHIDTLGNYSVCNLLDSSQEPPNKKGLKPLYCLKCEYKNAQLCNSCVSLSIGKTKCIFMKEYNEWLKTNISKEEIK